MSWKSGFIFALLASALAISAKAQTVATNINTYVLFAYDDLNFKGRNSNTTPPRAVITGGNVGTNRCRPNTNTPTLSFGGATTMATNGTQVVGDYVRIDAGSDIDYLFANYTSSGFSASVLRHSPVRSFSCPLIATSSLPTLPSFSPGSTNITVASNTTTSLSPGSYGDVVVHDDGVLNLSAGTYTLNSLNSGKNVRINTQPGVIVRIAGDFTFNNDCYVGPYNSASFMARSDNVGSNNPTVAFSRRTEFHGQVFAPNGILNLGNQTDLFGRFWSKVVNSDWDVNLTYSDGHEDHPLPVEFVSFDLSMDNGQVHLDWRTASEVDNDGFEVQRTYGNGDFSTIASRFTDPELAGLGTSPVGKHYSFIDRPSQAGTYSYRVVDVATDGIRTAHPSKSVIVESGAQNQLSLEKITPDPAQDRIVVGFSLQRSDAVTAEIFTADGRLIATPIKGRSYDGGDHSEEIAVGNLAPGTYYLRLNASTQSSIRPFVVVR